MRPSECRIEHTTASSGSRDTALAATCCATIPASTAFSISMWALSVSGVDLDNSSISFRPSARWPMASVPSTSTAFDTVLMRWPKAEYIPLLASRSTFWVRTGSDSTVWVIENSRSSSPRMDARIALMALVKPGMSPCLRMRSHSRDRVASARGVRAVSASVVMV